MITIFHYTEFLSIAVCSPKTLTPSSFMLNHSIAYGIAALTSWLEYIVWHYFLPGKKILKEYLVLLGYCDSPPPSMSHIDYRDYCAVICIIKTCIATCL